MGPIAAAPLDLPASCAAHAGIVARVDALHGDVSEVRAEVVRQGELTRATSCHVTGALGELAKELRAEMRGLACEVRQLRDAEQRRAGRSQSDDARDAWVDAHRRQVERSLWLRSRVFRVAVQLGALLAAAGAGGWIWQAAPAVWQALMSG